MHFESSTSRRSAQRLPARCKKEAVARILQAAINLEQRNKKLLRPRPTGTYRCFRRSLRRELELRCKRPTGTCISNSASPTKAQLASKSDAVNFQTSMLASHKAKKHSSSSLPCCLSAGACSLHWRPQDAQAVGQEPQNAAKHCRKVLK